jgi:hypothetical protein
MCQEGNTFQPRQQPLSPRFPAQHAQYTTVCIPPCLSLSLSPDGTQLLYAEAATRIMYAQGWPKRCFLCNCPALDEDRSSEICETEGNNTAKKATCVKEHSLNY